jgi:hypothetical protein
MTHCEQILSNPFIINHLLESRHPYNLSKKLRARTSLSAASSRSGAEPGPMVCFVNVQSVGPNHPLHFPKVLNLERKDRTPQVFFKSFYGSSLTSPGKSSFDIRRV